MFSQACIKNSVHGGGGCLPDPTPLGRHPPGSNPPPHPQTDTPSLGRPPAGGYCSGRYAFVWNAFLLLLLSLHASTYMFDVNVVNCPEFRSKMRRAIIGAFDNSIDRLPILAALYLILLLLWLICCCHV